ncbi:MAG TPA: hypothetical protein VGD14_13875 [bacterium]
MTIEEIKKLKDEEELTFHIPRKKIVLDDLISAVSACRDPREDRCVCKRCYSITLTGAECKNMLEA